jgi:hypothetical protein
MNQPFCGLWDEIPAGGRGGGGGSAIVAAAAGAGATGGAAAAAAGSVVQPPWFSNWLKPDGSLDHAALDKAPDRIKAEAASLKVFGKFDDFVDQLSHQRKLLSGKGLQPLRADASEPEKQAFRDHLRKLQGVPDDPKAYGFDQRPESVPADMFDPKFAETMAVAFHKAGVPPGAAKELFESYNGYVVAAVREAQAAEAAAAEQKLKEDHAKLDKAWGIQRPRMEQMAVRAMIAAGQDVNSDVMKIPEVAILAATFGGMVSEDRLPPINGAAGGQTAKEQFESLTNNPSNPLYAALWNPADPQHTRAVQVRDRLAEQLSAEQDRERGR